MKKIFALIAFYYFCIISLLASNKLIYTSDDGDIIIPQTTTWGIGVTMVSNTYSNGTGCITFSNEITEIGDKAFCCDNVTETGSNASGVSGTGNDIFWDTNHLTSVVIPYSIVKIGAYAFNGCSYVQTIKVQCVEPPIVGTGAFNGINKSTCKLFVSKGSKQAYLAAEQWKDFANIIEEDFLIKGDVNRDQRVSVSDISALISYLQKPTSTINKNTADANGDGVINTDDVEVIKTLLLGGN